MSAAQAIKIDSRREEQFNDIVANIKPFGTVGKGKPSEPSLAALWFHYRYVMWMNGIRE